MDLAGFAFAVLLIELTPGPNMAWLVALSLAEGRRAALAAVAGVTAGLALNAVLSSIGLAALLTAYPELLRWISFAGAVMMAWLAWNAWRTAGESSTGRLPQNSAQRHFVMGFVLNLLNVKAALFFLTIVPQFVDTGSAGWPQILILGLVNVLLATLIHLTLVLGADRIRTLLASPGRTERVRRTMALVMLGVSGWFLWGALA